MPIFEFTHLKIQSRVWIRPDYGKRGNTSKIRFMQQSQKMLVRVPTQYKFDFLVYITFTNLRSFFDMNSTFPEVKAKRV